jgi:hypothetical protein
MVTVLVISVKKENIIMITAKDLDRIELIKYLIKKYPNDMELGYNIRKLFIEQDDESIEEELTRGKVSKAFE